MLERLARARERWPLLDHLVRMVLHYGEVKGNLQAGAVTYFAFLSFFPILALAFFAVGIVAEFYSDAQEQVVDAIENVLPGMVAAEPEPGKIALSTIQENASAAGIIGLAGVLYAGLGWLSGMREALLVMFAVPPGEKPNFVVGKLRDLVSLALIGLVMVVSVAVAGAVTGFSEDILGFVGLGEELRPLLTALTVVIGLAANMLLFFAMFKLLAAPSEPARALWSGALLGAIGFEVLKRASVFLIASTKEQPAFQAFGIALILVVWIYYFSRVVMYSAAWAHTAVPAAAADAEEPGEAAATTALAPAGAAPPPKERSRLAPFAGGAAAMLGLVALARRTRRD